MASDRKKDAFLESLLQSFQAPPIAYRPAPFVILNDEYEPERGEQQLTRLIESLAEAGYGGAYLHPRPGLITEYLSDRWFELIRHCISECKRVGIIPHLYDENSYPSGFAGGHVSALVPEARSRYVTYAVGRGKSTIPAGALSLHSCVDGIPGDRISRDLVGDDTDWMAFFLQDMSPTAWHGETVYPSLLDPRTTEAFIETTYEKYRRELGDLWGSIPSIFTDEPQLPGSTHGPWSTGLHLTPYVIGQFRQRLGYDLAPHLAGLFFDVGEFQKIRYDFYDLCHRLWMENWALPLERWCQKHSIKFTGHYLEHDWPCPYATPGHVHLLAHMDWPGSDMLLGFLLKGHEFFDIQGFEPSKPGAEPHGLYFLRQIHSIANQLGKERVVNESWGAGGSETAPEDWMRIGRWMIVHGVNLIIPHSSWDTIRGGRKADHPPNFAPQSPWFDYLPPLNDEIARLCWATNQGKCVNRVLILDALTSGYCLSRKSESYTEIAAQIMIEPLQSAEEALPSIRPMKKAVEDLVQELSELQVDFDIGDEYVIEEFGGFGEGKLFVGERGYEIIVLPPRTRNLRSATEAALRQALRQGALVLGVKGDEIRIDGELSTAVHQWTLEYPHQVFFYSDETTLKKRVAELAPPRFSKKNGEAMEGVAHMHRAMPEAEFFVLTNSSPNPFSEIVRIRTKRKSVLMLNPTTGQCQPCESEPWDDGLGVLAEMNPGGAVVLLAFDDIDGFEPRVAHLRLDDALLTRGTELIEAERLGENALAIDYCSLEIGGEVHPAEPVYFANHRYWQAHGLETNGWNNIIQYRDQVLARDGAVAANSGGIVRYEVIIDARVDLSGIRLAIECPELWEVAVNGKQVHFSLEDTFRDPRIHWSAVGRYLQHGCNEIKLTATSFTVRQEIDQIYLLGDFACAPAEQGFHITPTRPLSFGSWKDLGMPFYDGEVSYRLTIPEGAKALQFPRDTWGGALIVATSKGVEIGRVYEAPWILDLIGHSLHEVEVRVVGLPINLFGPWHDPNHRWGVANTFMWFGEQVPAGPQPGANYQQIDLGLYRAPLVLL